MEWQRSTPRRSGSRSEVRRRTCDGRAGCCRNADGAVLSIVGAIAAGWLVRTMGSRAVIVGCAALTLVSLVVLGYLIDGIDAVPTQRERLAATLLVGAIGGFVSLNIAAFYLVMAAGYPQSCRAAAIGFHLTVARAGVITMVLFGGALMNLGGGSFAWYFGTMAAISLLMFSAAVIVDRHILPLRSIPDPA